MMKIQREKSGNDFLKMKGGKIPAYAAFILGLFIFQSSIFLSAVRAESDGQTQPVIYSEDHNLVRVIDPAKVDLVSDTPEIRQPSMMTSPFEAATLSLPGDFVEDAHHRQGGPFGHKQNQFFIANEKAAEGTEFSFEVSGRGPDGEVLAFVAKRLPAGATFEAQSGKFNWTPEFNQSGTYRITFKADQDGFIDTREYRIEVVNINQAPELDPVGDQSVKENERLHFRVKGSDPDGDRLTFKANGLPRGAIFDPAVQELIWTPAPDQTGNYDVDFSVTDGKIEAAESIRITVERSNPVPPLLGRRQAAAVFSDAHVLKINDKHLQNQILPDPLQN